MKIPFRFCRREILAWHRAEFRDFQSQVTQRWSRSANEEEPSAGDRCHEHRQCEQFSDHSGVRPNERSAEEHKIAGDVSRKEAEECDEAAGVDEACNKCERDRHQPIGFGFTVWRFRIPRTLRNKERKNYLPLFKAPSRSAMVASEADSVRCSLTLTASAALMTRRRFSPATLAISSSFQPRRMSSVSNAG